MEGKVTAPAENRNPVILPVASHNIELRVVTIDGVMCLTTLFKLLRLFGV